MTTTSMTAAARATHAALHGLVLAIAVGCMPSRPAVEAEIPSSTRAGQAIPTPDIRHLTSRDLDSLADLPTEPTRPARTLGDRGGYSYLLIRRAAPGEVEVHVAWDDVFIVRTGRATLLTGAVVEGSRATGPGEQRGGRITEAQTRLLGPGDVVVIPAGLAHQVVPDPGGTITYLVVKASGDFHTMRR